MFDPILQVLLFQHAVTSHDLLPNEMTLHVTVSLAKMSGQLFLLFINRDTGQDCRCIKAAGMHANWQLQLAHLYIMGPFLHIWAAKQLLNLENLSSDQGPFAALAIQLQLGDPCYFRS